MRSKRTLIVFAILFALSLAPLWLKGVMGARAKTAKPARIVAIEKIDHVTLAVSDLKKAMAVYGDLFGSEFYAVEPLGYEKWGVTKAALSATGIELVEAAATGEAAEFIKRAGEATLGIAFKAPDLAEAVAGMQARGIRLIGKAESKTRKVALFHPEDAHGVMIKLVEYIPAYTVAELEVVTRWRKTRSLTPLVELAKKPRINVEKLDHILIYVRQIEKARAFFGELLGSNFPEPHKSAVSASMLSIDGWGIELISGAPDSNVIKFIERRSAKGVSGEGVYAISFKVTNYEESVAAMEAIGLKPGATRDLPTRKVALYGSRSGPLGTGVELIQYRPLAHPIVSLEMRESLKRRGQK